MSILQVRNLKVHFPVKGGLLRRTVDTMKAVDGISIDIKEGQTYGLVGESGSGKTTMGRSIIGLTDKTSGSILFKGVELKNKRKRSKKDLRDIQMIFQDPYSSLNPKKRVLDIVAEPLRNYEKNTKWTEKHKVEVLMDQIGLTPESIYKYPHEFSGGQRQRIGVARALALHPKLIIADEPVSALDVSVQAQVLNFLKEIQTNLHLTLLFISHDIGVVRHMCDRIGVMYKGRLVEEGSSNDIYHNPQHIYTKRLIAAVPDINPENREKHSKHRKKIREEYEQTYKDYFDDEGEVMDMISISKTHSAALQRKG
ncbi:peptide/nickel transport system ATP-binding protein [Salibacterium salarium]|uniref:ABC transporter ATP-binding protein n=1 Tax=Salibacterium salarium TaxID=284579 RepID=UPI00278731B6|nr:ATP-binding cassette domain-containing protein [Salibacterium salarium]MDQ0298368.1 peptide/nickel transport system ATP-binding protein [Salibacterium salarium]